MKLGVEFVEGRPVHVLFPDFLEVKVKDTAPPTHQQQDSASKAAKLENGVEVMVPPMKYMDRVKVDAKTAR